MAKEYTHTEYTAVQVVSRHPNGALHEWFDGDQHGDQAAAERDRDKYAAEFPGTEYQVIERRIREIGPPKKLKKPCGKKR